MTDLRIASPCHESWEGMTPDGRGRHCASCAKTVVDVTAMSPGDARAFVADELPARIGRGDRVCVRAHADARGRLLRPGARRYLLTNGLAAVLAVTMAGCGGESPKVIVGDVYDPAATPNHATPEPRMGKPALPRPAEEPPMVGLIAPMRGEVVPAGEEEVVPPVMPEPTPANGTAALREGSWGQADDDQAMERASTA